MSYRCVLASSILFHGLNGGKWAGCLRIHAEARAPAR
jgi:hypothetical protein